MRVQAFAFRMLLAATGLAAMSAAPATAQTAIVQPGYAVVTGYAGFVLPPNPPADADPTDYLTIDPNGIAATVADLTKLGPQGALSTVPKPFSLTASQVGQVFGVALDDAAAPNIYLAATSAYGLSIGAPDASGLIKRSQTGEPGAQFLPGQFGPAAQGGGPGSIWRVDGTTGTVTVLKNIDAGTGSVAGLGGLAYDPGTKQLFATDRGTGIIYRLSLDGTVQGTYDHGTEGLPSAGLPPVPPSPVAPVNTQAPSFDTANPATWGLAPPARRVFALAVYNHRLYYSVAQGPEIWSAAITGSGAVTVGRLEVQVPALGDGEEIASIAFDGQGLMYLAERGPTTGDYTLTALATEGQSRTLRFVPKLPGDKSPGLWRLAPDVYSVGLPSPYQNADGGVALNYGYKADNTIDFSACAATVWSTGERLLDPGDGSTGFPTVDGIQGEATTLIQPQNMPPTAAWFVDYDDQAGNENFRGYMGAIATLPCAGQPLVCPNGYTNQNGACLPPPPPPRACKLPLIRYQSGACGCPNPNDVLSRDGKRCVPPPSTCNPRTEDLYNGACVQKCPGTWVHSGDNGRCVPPPCDLKTNDRYNGQCLPKCPRGLQRTGKDGKCLPPCPIGIAAIPGCGNGNPTKPPCADTNQEMYRGQCVDKCVPPKTRQKDGSCLAPLIPLVPLKPVCDPKSGACGPIIK